MAAGRNRSRPKAPRFPPSWMLPSASAADEVKPKLDLINQGNPTEAGPQMVCSARQPCGCRAHRSERCTASAPPCTPEGAQCGDQRLTLSTRRMARCQAFGERPRDPLRSNTTQSRRSEPGTNPRICGVAPTPEGVSMAGVPSRRRKPSHRPDSVVLVESEGDPRVRRPSVSRPKPALARPRHRSAEGPDAEASSGTPSWQARRRAFARSC